MKVLEDFEIRKPVDSIQTTAFSRLTRKEPQKLEEAYRHSGSSKRLSANTGVKNSQGIIMKLDAAQTSV